MIVDLIELQEVEISKVVNYIKEVGKSRIYADTVEYIVFLKDGGMYSIFLEQPKLCWFYILSY